MRQLLLAAAGTALLAYAPAASALDLDTGPNAYRQMNDQPAATYGAGGAPAAVAPGAGRENDGGFLAGLSVISPNDPTYSYSDPPHRGQPSLIDLNGDDGGRGTSYPQIIGHDSNGGGG